LIALIVAGLGVGATMQSHLRQKMPNIAFMKCIGGRSDHIVRIYLAQALIIGFFGSLIGVVAGAFAQAAFARLVANYFDIAVILIWPWSAMLKGIAAGISTAILFTLPALLSIAEIKPAFILRKEVAGDSRPRRDARSIIVGAVILAGLWGIAVWIGSSVKYASVFAGVLIGSLLVLGLLGALLMYVVRRVASYTAIRRSAALRHGVANLYRPG